MSSTATENVLQTPPPRLNLIRMCVKAEVHGLLTSVGDNLRGLLADLATPPGCYGLGPELARLLHETRALRENVEYLVGPYLQAARQAMADTNCDFDIIKSQYQNLQQEWDNQQEHLGRLQGDNYKLRGQIQNQSSFCASLGAIMGNLLWKASRLPAVIELLLAGNKLSEFFCVMSGSLISFLETYSHELPDQQTDETQFILSMSGIIANIAALPDGRNYLVNNPNGKELLEQILHVLPAIPSGSGDCLKRILLMALYNISINQNGLLMLQDQPSLLHTLASHISSDRTPELKAMALKLLQSITYEISSQTVLQIITKIIPTHRIEALLNTSDAEMRTTAQDILDNIGRAEMKYINKPPTGPTLPYEQCYLTSNAQQLNAKPQYNMKQ